MNDIGQAEIKTQERLIGQFIALGYKYLGNWKSREDNSNCEETYLRPWLEKQGYSEALINRSLHEFRKENVIASGDSLYSTNEEIYNLLRYGIKVRESHGENKQTVMFIDWKEPLNNEFYLAEEVTVKGQNTKRPDLVLYVNGIALGVIELKRSTVTLDQGIRQNLDNQKKEFIRGFFTTMQLVMAGNDTQGLQYGSIETREKYYLGWKEDGEECQGNPLDWGVHKLLNKERFLEIIHDFIVFDAGVKKTCRQNQYFGVRAAQARLAEKQGGIIWHTQGSGKSLSMVWLAKWILENEDDSRVLIITDRSELDEQIEKVFLGVKENIYRTKNGADLVNVLNENTEPLISSLVHKFGSSGDDEFLSAMEKSMGSNFSAKGNVFVFVDECHRTQSGTLHSAMKKLLPDALFIGFTGTPLLKKDKKKSVETFGSYIHCYRFNEAVKDKVVLDLRYEARDIDQDIRSQDKIDQWFESKTRGLSDIGLAQVKQRWGTMKALYSSEDRLKRIVSDIVLDMATKPRLSSSHGNAILVAGSIYQACRFYELFSGTSLNGKCAVVTSYSPAVSDLRGESNSEGDTEKVYQYRVYKKMLSEYFDDYSDAVLGKADEFEKKVKKQFEKHPGQMRLLIVVDKLLTGYDAPPCTFLYIDKKMQDHGLFQAICRVNRLDGESKDVGYIVDYKDLFKSLEKAMDDFTGEAFEDYDHEDVAGLLTDRFEKACEALDVARETVKALCEPVRAPKDTSAYAEYFIAGNQYDQEEAQIYDQRRLILYKHVASFVRSYVALANEMEDAGYSEKEALEIKDEVKYYQNLKDEMKLMSADYVNMKGLEVSMRQMLDMYITAEDSKILHDFGEATLVDLLVKEGFGAVEENVPAGLKSNDGDLGPMGEAIENNIRKIIIDEMEVNPQYYQKMSDLLEALVVDRKRKALQYKEYLQKVTELAREVVDGGSSASKYPESIKTAAQRALYDNLYCEEELALRIDKAVRENKPADFRGNKMKERKVKRAIESALNDSSEGEVRESAYDVEQLFKLVKAQREY